MNRDNIVIKKILTIDARISMINFLTNNCFITDENGVTYYTPYFKETNFMEAFFRYAVDGLMFDEGDNIFEIVSTDNELTKLYDDWMHNIFAKKTTSLAKQIAGIMSEVEDMVSFRKDMLIASQSNSGISPTIEMKLLELIEKENNRNVTEVQALNELHKFYENQNKIFELMEPDEYVEIMRKMSENNFNPNETVNLLADKYFGSGEHAAKLSDLFDNKQNVIKKQEKEIAEKKKKIMDMTTARNALNG